MNKDFLKEIKGTYQQHSSLKKMKDQKKNGHLGATGKIKIDCTITITVKFLYSGKWYSYTEGFTAKLS